MIITTDARQPDPRPVAGPEGNATDLRFLEGAVASLEPIVVACAAAAARSSQPEVRAVALASLSALTDRLSAVSALLDDWGRAPVPPPRPSAADAPEWPHAEPLDGDFLERLAAYTHASTADARAEMVTGASRSARLLAERAIHADDRQLAALRASAAAARL